MVAAMRSSLALAAVVLVALALPSSSSAATCSDYSNQAAAQAAADTRDADGDGVYCESLPCPCAKPGSSSPPPRPAPKPAKPTCVKTNRVQPIGFSKTKYPNIREHYMFAVEQGWPRVLVLNRPGADARRDRLLRDIPTKRGFDRDEFPPAIGRGRARGSARGLVRGLNPVGWMADVAYVPSSENRSHGSTLGLKLRRFCNGQAFRYVFF